MAPEHSAFLRVRHVSRRRLEVDLTDARAATSVDVTAALGDQEASVRVSALSSLGRIRADGAGASVAQILAGDRDTSVHRAAIWTLSTLRSEDAHRAIEAAASDSDWSVRRAAAGALRAWQLRHAHAN